MTDTAASHQWAIEMFWALFWGALTSSIFILQSMVSTISSCYDCFPIPQLATRHKALSDLGLGGVGNTICFIFGDFCTLY